MRGVARYLNNKSLKQLPMQENSTHLFTTKSDNQQDNKPRQSTIEFLQMFARVCTYQKQTQYNAVAFCAN